MAAVRKFLGLSVTVLCCRGLPASLAVRYLSVWPQSPPCSAVAMKIRRFHSMFMVTTCIYSLCPMFMCRRRYVARVGGHVTGTEARCDRGPISQKWSPPATMLCLPGHLLHLCPIIDELKQIPEWVTIARESAMVDSAQLVGGVKRRALRRLCHSKKSTRRRTLWVPLKNLVLCSQFCFNSSAAAANLPSRTPPLPLRAGIGLPGARRSGWASSSRFKLTLPHIRFRNLECR